MKLAKVVFWIAAIWGVLIITPLYFIFDVIGRNDPPPITHPEFFYGFIGVTIAWQVVFLIISRDPQRYRTLMIAAVLEKAVFVIAVAILFAQNRIGGTVLVPAGIDLVLGVLFVISFLKTRPANS